MGYLTKTTTEVERDMQEGLDNQPKVNLVWDDLRFPASGINPAGQIAPPTIDTARS